MCSDVYATLTESVNKAKPGFLDQKRVSKDIGGNWYLNAIEYQGHLISEAERSRPNSPVLVK